MIKSKIVVKLAQNLKFMKRADTPSKIHSSTKNLCFAICNIPNQFVKYNHAKQPYRQASEGDGVQNLCSTSLDVMYNKTSFNVLQSRTNNLLSHAGSFKIDELLLLLCPYAMYVDSYSTWFRVNYTDFNTALAIYNRHLLCNVSDMSIEQMYFMIELFRKLSKRYPQYALTDYPLLSSLISKLIFFSENVPSPGEPPSRFHSLQNNRLSSEVNSYNTTLQNVYNCYYPYFKMIYTGLEQMRQYTEYLTKSCAHVQSLIMEQNYTEILRHFEDLCESLSKLKSQKFLKLATVVRLATIFERNSKLYPKRQIVKMPDLVNKLAISLHSLTIHMYVANEEPPGLGDDQFVDVTLKMFTKVLDTVSISEISDCLASLQASGHLNEHLLKLFVPYIVNDLSNVPLNDLIKLMIQLTNYKFYHWLFWITLAQGIQVKKLNQIRDLELLNDFYSCLTLQNQRLIESKNIAQVNSLCFIHVTKLGEDDQELTQENYTPIYSILTDLFELKDPDLQSMVNTYTKLLYELDEYFNLDTVGSLENSQLLETFLNTRTKFKNIQAEI
ncbi:hypothetical protein MACK_000370 [Theileria orientalis]|uniref:Uncharacterized protein n=1 Tax=Theileria orientalis TaxID=68886 RepID=A0A976M9U8_THEOR|nr:hypothetical protein MACK_000370 [Theileria orientalis]